MHCQYTHKWTGGGTVASTEAPCPPGTYLMTGGFSARVVGYTVSTSSVVAGAQRWRVVLTRIHGVSVPPTLPQELTVTLVCRRE